MPEEASEEERAARLFALLREHAARGAFVLAPAIETPS
jgi:hypothetical protein